MEVPFILICIGKGLALIYVCMYVVTGERLDLYLYDISVYSKLV